MRLPSLLPQISLLFLTVPTALAASWTFTDGSVSVTSKGAGVGAGEKSKLVPGKPLPDAVTLGATDTLKVVLTTQEGNKAKRPHQAFLLLQDATTGLDISYPLSVKESGKAKLELTPKDLPAQFFRAPSPISASVVVASFDTSSPYLHEAFTLRLDLDANVPIPHPVGAATEPPLRYGKQPEIRHIFRPEPQSPPIVISIAFLGAVLATVPGLVGVWLYLGGNVAHLSKALQDAPLSHLLFVGSITSIEGVFFLYYTSWNLFRTLPVLAVLGLVAYTSGSRALTEVQGRRLAGLR